MSKLQRQTVKQEILVTLERRWLNAKRGQKRKSTAATMLNAEIAIEMMMRSKAGWERRSEPEEREELDMLHFTHK